MGDGVAVKVLVVIVIGIAVGVAIELALGYRQRSRRVVLDEPDLPPGIEFVREPTPSKRRRRSAGVSAADATVMFDEDGGFRILGPVSYDDASVGPPRSESGIGDTGDAPTDNGTP